MRFHFEGFDFSIRGLGLCDFKTIRNDIQGTDRIKSYSFIRTYILIDVVMASVLHTIFE